MEHEGLVLTDDAKRVSTTIDVRVDELINMNRQQTFRLFHHHMVETLGPQLKLRFGNEYQPVFSHMTYQVMHLVSGTIEEPGEKLRFNISGLPEPF